MQFISRTGTGTLGSSSSPISISFNFVPLWICAEWDNSSKFEYSASSSPLYTCLVSSLTESFVSAKPFYGAMSNGQGKNYVYGKRSSDSKTIYWYGEENSWISVATIFNISGHVYIFSAYA